MQQIPLSAVPSQDLSVNLDGVYWRLKFYLSMEFVCVDILRDGEMLMSGIRCFVDQPLLPYSYMYAPQYGNFIFDSDVDWENFGDSCSLYYLDAAELEEYNNLKLNGYGQVAIKGMMSRAAKFKASGEITNRPIVDIAPVITTDLVGQTVNIGDDVVFQVAATSAVEYSLQMAPQISGTAWRTLSTNETGTFNLDDVSAADAGYYRVVALSLTSAANSSSVLLKIAGVNL